MTNVVDRRAVLMIAVFSIVGATLFAGCTNTPSKVSSDVYPGSQTYTPSAFIYSAISIPTEGVETKGYSVPDGNIQDILNWFKNKMLSEGWELRENISIINISVPQTGTILYGGTIFKKGDRGKGIWAWQEDNNTYYVVVTGPWSKISSGNEAEQLPSSDQAQGEEPIERYPGSVLLDYYSSGPPTDLYIDLDYGTSDEVDTVVAWYKQYLQSNGWSLDDEGSNLMGDNSYSLDFSKGGETLSIDIYGPSETWAKDYTEISVYYHKKGLPAEDQASGYEPVSRYPGSVMLEHTDLTFSDMRTVSISYGTTDSVDDVKNWYISNIPAEGWTLLGTTTISDGVEITFTKGTSTTLQVTIESSGYNTTSIDILYTSPA